MRIQNINNNLISFQKQLMAQCTLKNEAGQNEICNIYELDSKKDNNYFMELNKESDWVENELLSGINACLRRDLRPVYTLENSKGKCLGYISAEEIYTMEEGTLTSIDTLETIPTQKFQDKNNRIKYIGETLLSFITQKAKDDDHQALYVYEYFNATKNFYVKNCGFEDKGFNGLRLDEDDFDTFISKNKEHSQLKIFV